VTGSTLSNNSAQFLGGGIYNGSFKTTTTLVDSCTISGNSASFGGGIYLDFFNFLLTVRVQFSTLTGNTATIGGGAIFNNGSTLFVDFNIFCMNTPDAIEGPAFDYFSNIFC